MGKHILLVDDDLASLKLTQSLLEHMGHLVEVASTGLQAKRLLRAVEFDLVVTDIFMPDMDGLELIRYVCEAAANTPIVAISGGDSSNRINLLSIASELGADVVLSKPVLPRVLREAIDGAKVTRSKGYRHAPRKSP